MSSKAVRVIGGLLLAGAAAGCSTTVPGTPRADPAQMSVAGPQTTCRQYAEMTDSAKFDVIVAIGEKDAKFAQFPEIWMGLADTLCSFADPDATVLDMLTLGKGN